MKQFKEIIVGVYGGMYFYSVQADGELYDKHDHSHAPDEIREILDIVYEATYSAFEILAVKYPHTRIICVCDGGIEDTGVR